MGIRPGQRRGSHEQDANSYQQEAAAAEDPGDSRIEDRAQGQGDPQRGQRSVARRTEQAEHLDRGQGCGQDNGGGQYLSADGQDDQEHRHEHRGADRALTHRPS